MQYKFVMLKGKVARRGYILFCDINLQKGNKNMAKTTVRTGGKAPISGQYRPNGKKSEVTFVAGHKVPPTKSGSTTYTLVDSTKHKGDK